MIKSSLLKASEDFLWVEMQMWNKEETQLKSLLWTHFISIDIKTGKRGNHPEAFMEFARSVEKTDTPATGSLKERIQYLYSLLTEEVK